MLDAGAAPRSAPTSGVRGGLALAAAGATAAWIARYGFGSDAFVAAGFVVVLAVLTAVDLEERRIPNAIVLPAAAVTLAAVPLLYPDQALASVVASGGAFLFFFVPSLISARSVGMGDAKLALLIGAMLGSDVVAALFVTAITGGVAGAALLAMRGRRGGAASIPYGPFLSAGAVVTFLAGGGTLYS